MHIVSNWNPCWFLTVKLQKKKKKLKAIAKPARDMRHWAASWFRVRGGVAFRVLQLRYARGLRMVSNQPLFLRARGCLLTKGASNSYRKRTWSSKECLKYSSLQAEIIWLKPLLICSPSAKCICSQDTQGFPKTYSIPSEVSGLIQGQSIAGCYHKRESYKIH